MTPLEQFKNVRAVVIGDLMLDKNILGKVTRVSPEAPIPVVSVSGEENRPGGASNAANNMKSLGAQVKLIGLVGDDDARDVLVEECESRGIDTKGFVVAFDKPTIQKIRVYSGNHYLARYDFEKTTPLTEDQVVEFLSVVEEATNDCDVVIISDYNKGINHPQVMSGVITLCKRKGIPLIIDPKVKNCELYKGAFCVKPNAKEAQEMTGISTATEEGIIQAGMELVKRLESHVILTASERGMYIFNKENISIWKHIKTQAQTVVDVTGAGDTVGAAIGMSLASGATLEEAAQIATAAAACAIKKQGTATVTLEELKGDMYNEYH